MLNCFLPGHHYFAKKFKKLLVNYCSPATVPVIAECEGSYEYIKSKSQLLWSLAVIDGSNNCGTLEFNTPNGRTDHFFPINLRFWSADLFCDIRVSIIYQF